MTIAQPIIDVEDVTFSYGNAPVLERVNLQVHDGEFLGIVGPNAGGKSTLLKIILGLLQPQSGRTRVLGRRPRLACRMIGYVPQHPSFPRDFPITVEQVVLLGRLGVKQSGHWLGGIWPSFLGTADRQAARRALPRGQPRRARVQGVKQHRLGMPAQGRSQGHACCEQGGQIRFKVLFHDFVFPGPLSPL